MNLYQVFPATSETYPLATAADKRVVAKTLEAPTKPLIRAVMVTNSAGHTVDADASSRGLSLGVDRTLLGLYREASDIVLVGATTVRREPVPTPRTSALAIVSASGDLSGHQLVVRENAKLFLVTNAEGALVAQQTFQGVPFTPVLVHSDEAMSATDIMESLSAYTSTEHCVIEGGRVLWETFAGITDEVCISVTPPPLDSHAGIPPWWPFPTDSWTLASLMTDDAKMLYYRYRTGIRGAP